MHNIILEEIVSWKPNSMSSKDVQDVWEEVVQVRGVESG